MQSWFYFKVNKVGCTECFAKSDKQELLDLSFAATPTNTITSDILGHSGGLCIIFSVKKNISNQIRKPLIFVEGYYRSLVAPALQNANYSIEDY